jgi:hypothetical protein
MANSRKKKNFIYSLKIDNGMATSQSEKEQVVFNHYHLHTGTYVPRNCKLNFSELGWQPINLEHLDHPFTEEEVKVVISQAPKEKAHVPDDFIGKFFAQCWETLKHDILAAVHFFYLQNQQNLHYLNHAFVVLIPKSLTLNLSQIIGLLA